MRLVNPTASDIAFIALLMRPQQNSLYGTASNVRAYSSPPLAVGVRGRRGFIRPALAPSNDGPTQSRECLLGILLGELSLHESSCFNNKKSFITNFLPELYEIAADAIDGAATPAHGDALSPSSSNPTSTLRVLIRGFAIVCIVLAAQYSAAMTGGDSDRDGEKKSTKAPVRRRWDLKGAGLAAYKAAYQNASRTSRYDFTTMALDGQLPEDDGIPTDNSVKEYANLGFALLDGLTDDAYDSVIAFFDTATDNYSGHTLWQHLTGAGSDETALQQKFADIAALLRSSRVQMQLGDWADHLRKLLATVLNSGSLAFKDVEIADELMMTIILAGVEDSTVATNILHFKYKAVEALEYLNRLQLNSENAAKINGVTSANATQHDNLAMVVCRSYASTGSCKFGRECKYEHVRNKDKGGDRGNGGDRGGNGNKGKELCRLFKQGKCSFGDRWKYKHGDKPNALVLAAKADAGNDMSDAKAALTKMSDSVDKRFNGMKDALGMDAETCGFIAVEPDFTHESDIAMAGPAFFFFPIYDFGFLNRPGSNFGKRLGIFDSFYL